MSQPETRLEQDLAGDLVVPVVQLLKRIREPVLVALASASSETAHPQTMKHLPKFWARNGFPGVVLPLGHSFNLEGSMVYQAFSAGHRSGPLHRPRATNVLGDSVGTAVVAKWEGELEAPRCVEDEALAAAEPAAALPETSTSHPLGIS